MTDSAKLLFVLNGLGIAGSETKIVRVSNALARSGCSVEIAYLDRREALVPRIEPSILATCLERRGKYSIAALRRLKALVGDSQCVLVAVNLYPLLYTIPMAWWTSREKVKTVALVNTSQVGSSARRLGRMYSPFLRRCDRLVFGCRSELRTWVDAFSLPESRSEYLYNGVDETYFSLAGHVMEGARLREVYGIPRQAVVFGSVGRLVPLKAFDKAVAAVARLNELGRTCYLALVGQGAESARLHELTGEFGIDDKVKFLGLQNDVRPALAMMDAFVLPSTTETFSNAALEAMSMERPVILGRVGGAPEMVEHGVNGLLFEPGDVDSLTNALMTMHESHDLRCNMGRAARLRVLQLFRFSDMVARYRQLASI
jgi:glycosyltransferase involved in cell wall biosynthesis